MNKQTSRFMIEIQLNNICKIVNGTWHRQSLLNSKGEPSERIITLTPVLMLLGLIVSTLSIIVVGYIHEHMHLITTLKNAINS